MKILCSTGTCKKHSYTKEESSIRKVLTIAVFSTLLLLFPSIFTEAKAPTIQQQIDESKPGETIQLNDGMYEESIIIKKPIHLSGSEDVTLRQEGSDPVINIQSDNVVLENLNVEYENDHSESSAILINGDNNLLNTINIHTNSYGIQLDEANHNRLSDLTITGIKKEAIKNRKHGIDLWKSNNNEIYDTRIKYVQDGIYMEKSHANKIYRNSASHSRYGYHLMFTKNTELEENESYENISGMMIMGTEGTVAKHNTLRDNQENIQSLGLLLFDVKDASIKGNIITNNRIGIFIESASDNELAFNTITGNYIGLQFKGAKNNTIANNSLVANVVQGQAQESSDNNTNQNYWGDHLGLDITGDQTSNLTYQVDPFFLNVTSEYPPFQLLFQSPGMVFLEQLIQIPVDEQLVDETPLMANPLAVTEDVSGDRLTVLLLCISLIIISTLIIYLGVKKQ